MKDLKPDTVGWPMLAIVASVFIYTAYAAIQLGAVQQQVLTSVKILDETKGATERLAAESRATTERLASETKASTERLAAESRMATEKLASETKATTERLAAESRAATEKLASESMSQRLSLATADTILRERVARMEETIDSIRAQLKMIQK